jgi:hypothetical protein
MPQSVDNRVHGQHGAVFGIGDKLIGTGRKDGSRAGYIKEHTGSDDACPQGIRGGVPGTCGNDRAGRQSKFPGSLLRDTSPMMSHGATIRGSLSISRPKRSQSSPDQVTLRASEKPEK